MGFSLIRTGQDGFLRPDENPITPANWGPVSTDNALAILNNQAVPTFQASGSFFYGANFWTGSSVGNDQYASVQVEYKTPAPITSAVDLYLRTAANFSTSYNVDLFGADGNIWNLGIFGGGINTQVQVPVPGRVTTITAVVIGTSVYALYNGVIVLSATDAALSSGSVAIDLFTVSPGLQTDVVYTFFEAGNVVPSSSLIDSRNYGNFPNEAVVEGGTAVYTFQTESRTAGAPLDCRTAGAPRDSRVNPPQNSRS